jgi:hypothetical protein
LHPVHLSAGNGLCPVYLEMIDPSSRTLTPYLRRVLFGAAGPLTECFADDPVEPRPEATHT